MRIAILIVAMVSWSAHAQERKWVNPDLYDAERRGEISVRELDREFEIALGTCRMEAFKIAVPAPTCIENRPHYCSPDLPSGLYGMCMARRQHRPLQTCDYSARNEAFHAQDQILESCMLVKGWKLSDSVRDEYRSRVSTQEKEQRFLQRLDSEVPDWEAINELPSFKRFLGRQHKKTGRTRSDVLVGAAQQYDADTVIALFKEFQSLRVPAGNRSTP